MVVGWTLALIRRRPLARQQPFKAKPVAIGESSKVLMLDPAEPSEFAFVDAVPLRIQGDPGTHRGFERAPLLELFRVHALLPRSAGGVRSQIFNVVVDSAFDPLRLYVRVAMLTGVECARFHARCPRRSAPASAVLHQG